MLQQDCTVLRIMNKFLENKIVKPNFKNKFECVSWYVIAKSDGLLCPQDEVIMVEGHASCGLGPVSKRVNDLLKQILQNTYWS